MDFDVIIIGGSYAGLSAALPLARARRRVLIVDGGERRNRFATHSHGFLTQDGVPPGEIAARARAQVLAYPTVAWRDGHVEAASGRADAFTVTLRDGATFTARRLVLAAGVTDTLPDVPGVAERWGTRVFHCPYCHGYELDQGRIGVLASSPMAMHQAAMLPEWGHTTLFLNGAFAPDAGQRAELVARGVEIEPEPVARLTGDDAVEVVLADGRVRVLDGLFVAPRVSVGGLAAQLGLDMDDTPMGTVVWTDPMKATSLPGVFACGDVARAAGSVALAVGDGAMAGLGAHRTLMFGM